MTRWPPTCARCKQLLIGALNPAAVTRVQDSALKQNINTLHNRINELGVAEPVIQQQGNDRIVVQLPGVQDGPRPRNCWAAPPPLKSAWSTIPRRAGRAAGRFRAVRPGTLQRPRRPRHPGPPPGHPDRREPAGRPARPRLADPAGRRTPTLDAKGARIFRDVTRDNINKRMAILLFENGRRSGHRAGHPRRDRRRPGADLGQHVVRGSRRHALLLRAGRWPRRCPSSRNAPSAPAWAPTTSPRASTRRCTASWRSPRSSSCTTTCSACSRPSA